MACWRGHQGHAWALNDHRQADLQVCDPKHSGALLDPTLDAASDIFQAATGAVAAGDFERSDLHTVRKLLPAQLFWLRTHFDRVVKATGDAAREEQLT
ncbi:MAG: hypothetical protein EOR57_31000 [Mesorhizobium sp.]|uniref:hypothetical protein n=1 Tax=Mesorhizobium sp. TaxID=1871066 RepID=UPI000FE8F027|nr:hypothetical protein [Mesorhizobium sp.]RWL15183.1 MAG: hypothetical protein EOR57_31000 [Mesorhizobium sp.]